MVNLYRSEGSRETFLSSFKALAVEMGLYANGEPRLRGRGQLQERLLGSWLCLKVLTTAHMKVVTKSTEGGFCFSSSGIFTPVVIPLLGFVRGKDLIAQ